MIVKFTLVLQYKRINKIIRILQSVDYVDVSEYKKDKDSILVRSIFYFLIAVKYIIVRKIINHGVLRANIIEINPKHFTFWSMLRLYYLNLPFRKPIEYSIGAVIIGLIIAFLTKKLGLT